LNDISGVRRIDALISLGGIFNKILESDYLSGNGGSFSDSFSGTATLTFNTREWGAQSLGFPLIGSVSGSVAPAGIVEAMSGFFFNCRELSFEVSVIIDPYGDSTEMNFPNCSYLAPGVGSVREKLYEDDEDGGSICQYDAVLTSGRVNGETIRPVDVYSLAVNNGSGDGTMYTNSQSVAILADSAPSGKIFGHWTVSPSQYAANLVNADSASTMFVMPDAVVTLTAVYVNLYSLNVMNGSGDGASYMNGQLVVIAADTSPDGQAFDRWTGATQYIANLTASSTTITMPDSDINVTATYKDLPRVAASAGEGGSVSPDTEQIVSFGESLTLTADPDAGHKVKHWLVNNEIQGTADKALTLTNITSDMTVVVVFEKVKAMPWLNLLLE